MAWSEYIKGNKNNLLKALNMMYGAVRKMRYLASFKTRKRMAEANLFLHQILSIFLVDVYKNRTKAGH